MALKVAELFAELGLDAREFDRGLDSQIKTGAKRLDQLVDEADKVGERAGDALADGIGDGAAEGGDEAADRLADADGQLRRVADDLGHHAGDALVDGMGDATVDIGDDTEARLRANTADLDIRARQVGEETGDAIADGVDNGARGIGDGLDERLRSETAGLPSRGRQAGEETGDNMAAGVIDGFDSVDGAISSVVEGSLGNLPVGLGGPAVAAGAALGAGIVAGIGQSMETERVADVVATRIGNIGQSDRFERVAHDLMGEALGEAADIGDAIDAVYSTIADTRDSEEGLERIARKALMFSDVFEQDLSQSVANAGILMRVDLARDADHAFDLIVGGASNVSQFVRDELADATHEYSQFFASLGFTGEEMFSMLIDVADGGTYAIDKMGDSIKELAIRATDLDDTGAMEALETLGLNVESTVNRLLEGGPAAREATQEIIAALQSMDDPGKQAAAAVALLGAPIEDLGKSEIPTFIDALNEATEAQINFTGAADGLEAAFENQATKIDIAWASLKGYLAEVGNWLATPLANEVDGRFPSDPDLSPEQRSGIASVLPSWLVDPDFVAGGPSGYAGSVASGDAADTTGQGLGAAIGRASVADTERALTAVEGFRGGIDRWRVSADAAGVSAADLADQVAGLGDRVEPTTDSIFQAEVALESFTTALEKGSTGGELAGLLRVHDTVTDLRDVVGDLPRDVDRAMVGLKGGFGDIGDEAEDALSTVLSAGADMRSEVVSAFEWGGADAARAKADELREGLRKVFAQVGITGDKWVEYQAILGLTDTQVETAITVSGMDVAIAQIQILHDMLGEDLGGDGNRGIRAHISALIAEGEFETVRNLLVAFSDDMTDGSITNPILLALNADPTMAEREVDVLRWNVAATPATITIDADMTPAQRALAEFANRLPATSPMAVLFGASIGATNLKGEPVRGARASGGPIDPGRWLVGEKGPEIVDIPAAGHVHNADETERMLAAASQVWAQPAAAPAASSPDNSLLVEVRQLRTALASITAAPAIGEITVNEATPTQTLAELSAGVRAGRIIQGATR